MDTSKKLIKPKIESFQSIDLMMDFKVSQDEYDQHSSF